MSRLISSGHAPRRTLARLLLLLPVLATAAGCQYQHQELFPADYRSITLPIFENRTFYRGVEFELSEALAKEIELRTPYKVVPEARADTVLAGTITAIDQDQLSRRLESGVPQELEVELTVNFEWKEVRTGQVIRQRRGFTVVGRYVPTPPVSEPFQVAQHEAVRRLAEAIVSVMRADW